MIATKICVLSAIGKKLAKPPMTVAAILDLGQFGGLRVVGKFITGGFVIFQTLSESLKQ